MLVLLLKGYVVKANEIFNDFVIYNMDVSDKYTVIEYDKKINNNHFHYIALYDISNEYIYDIVNFDNEFINDDMYFPSVSKDGKYIVFTSRADNIVNESINDCYDIEDGNIKKCSSIYVYNTIEKNFTLLKYNEQLFEKDNYVAKISGDGNTIVFESLFNVKENNNDCSDLNGVKECINIYRYNMLNQTTLLVSGSDKNISNRNSINPSINYDGRYITYQSNASNIIELSPNYNMCFNNYNDKLVPCMNIYLFDYLKKETKVISGEKEYVFNNHSGNSIISQNAMFVAYETYATNISDSINYRKHVVIYDVIKEINYIVTMNNNKLNNRDSNLMDISYDGKYVLYTTNSTNLTENKSIFLPYVVNTINFKTSVALKSENDIKLCEINNNEIYMLNDSNSFLKYKIDSVPPLIIDDQKIYVLSKNRNEIINKIEIIDNLSSNDMLQIFIENSNEIVLGSNNLIVKAIDEFGNMTTNTVYVEVLNEDNEGPVFNLLSQIKILKGSQELNLIDYIYAYDKIDGRVKIYLIEDNGLDLSKEGKYKLKLMSKDKSENHSYIEVYVTVYDNYSFMKYYEIFIAFVLIIGVIFLLIKVK